MRPLRIAVCVKPVPDPKQSNTLKIDPATKTLVRTGIPLVINPLDKNALEAAIKLKAGGGTVSVFSMAPPTAESTLTETLAMGADEAFLLSDRAFAGGDTLATARVLVAGIQKQDPYDLILCGAESFDGGTAQVGPQIAVLLGLPWVTRVFQLSRSNDEQLAAAIEDEHVIRELLVEMPLVITVEASLNQPRRISLMGVVAARKKTITVYNAADLGVDPAEVGLGGSPTQTWDYFSPSSDKKVEMWQGSSQELARELIQKLGL